MNNDATTTDKPEAATARVTLLMTPTEKRELFAKAKETGYGSVGEFLRDKAFDRDSSGARAAIKLMHTAIAATLEATDTALAAVNEAIATSAGTNGKADSSTTPKGA